MQKLIIVTLALLAVAAATSPPLVAPEPPKVIRQYLEQNPDGSYRTGYETENGIKSEETGELKEVLGEDGKPHVILSVRGQYSYINNEGSTEAVSYGADDKGFSAEGASIPKA